MPLEIFKSTYFKAIKLDNLCAADYMRKLKKKKLKVSGKGEQMTVLSTFASFAILDHSILHSS